MSVTAAPRTRLSTAPWAVVVVAYGLCMTTACVLDRLNHRSFAFSRFCADDASQLDSGPFGRKHCSEHYLEWTLASRWVNSLWELLVPSLGAELRFVGAYGALTLLGWLNWVVGFVLVIGGALGVLKTYAWIAGARAKHV